MGLTVELVATCRLCLQFYYCTKQVFTVVVIQKRKSYRKKLVTISLLRSLSEKNDGMLSKNI